MALASGSMLAHRRILLALSSAYFVIGFWVATTPAGPLLAVDDVAYLSMGRTLAGGGEAPLHAQAPYGFLYPLLTVPAWLLGFGEDAVHAYARGVNALAGALLVPVLYAVLRRLRSPDPSIALLGAAVGAALPALWLTASIAWTERLLTLLVAVAVLCVLRLADEATLARQGAVTATAIALYATHPRMGPATVVVLLAGAAALFRGRPGLAVGGLAVGGGLLALVDPIRAAIATVAFNSSGRYDVGDLSSRRGLSEIGDMAQHGVGTLAYLALAGTGLVVLGSIWWWRSRPAGYLMFAILAAVVGMAGWFLTGVPRADSWLHGRYVEVLAPLLVGAGVVGLTRLPWRTVAVSLVGVPIVAGVIAAWVGPGDNWRVPRSPVMMLGVEVGGAPFGNDVFEPGAAASVAIVVGLAGWFGWRFGRTLLTGAVFAVAVTLGVVSGLETLDQLHDGTLAGQLRDALADPDLEPISHLTVELSGTSPNLVSALAWEVGLDNTSIELVPATSHLLVPSGTSAPSGATLVAEFNGGTLWEMG